MTPEEHNDIMLQLGGLRGEIANLSDRVGFEGRDGDGSGLTGRVMRTESKVESLLSDRNMLRGAAAVVIAIGAFLVAMVKGWLSAIMTHGAPHS